MYLWKKKTFIRRLGSVIRIGIVEFTKKAKPLIVDGDFDNTVRFLSKFMSLTEGRVRL